MQQQRSAAPTLPTREDFPEELTDRPQWLVWRLVSKTGQAKPAKLPYYATTGHTRGWPHGRPRNGKPTDTQPQVEQGHEQDRAHLVTFADAVTAAQVRGFDGIGFAFLPGDGLVGIDLDGLNLDPERHRRAESIVAACASFTEESPSGNGLHIIGFGEAETIKDNGIGVELFVGRQFFTMTGRRRQDMPAAVTTIRPSVLAKIARTVEDAREAVRLAKQAERDAGDAVVRASRAAAPDAPVAGTTAATQAEASRYCLAALESGVQRLRRASEGGRNDLLNGEAFGLAQLVHTGGISEATIRAALTDAALSCGLPEGEVVATVRSGINAGLQQPRAIPERQHRPAPHAGPAPAAPPRSAPVDPETGEVLSAPLAAVAEDEPRHVAPRSRFDMHRVDWFSQFPDVTGKGKPIATIENVEEACRRLDVVVRYNVISKEIELIIPGEGFTIDNTANASLAWLESACSRFGVPTAPLGGYLCYLADRNPFNPVAEWITSKPWDGLDRLPDLYDTIRAEGEATDPEIGRLKRAMMRRWLLSAVAAAFRPNGVSAHGVLVLQGEQYLGKTQWFKKLVPAELGVIQDGLMLRPDDRDSVKQCVSFWLVELGELDATFRKSDIAQLKSFLTRDRDSLRRAYAKLESHYARRTVFFASVNPRQFLHDPSGNRRYWTIPCEAIDHGHNLDMQQIWAQVLVLFEAGESWYLAADEMGALNAQNKDHEVLDPIRERMQTRFDWDAQPVDWRWMTATDILSDIGFDRPTQGDVTKAGQIILELNGKQQKRSHGIRRSRVPPRRGSPSE